jgi:mutator protein MutT
MDNLTPEKYSIIPEGEIFSPSLEVAGCFIECDSKILYIKRNPHISQGNTWCIPGGKLEKGETPLNGAVREVWEEVGITLETLSYIGKIQIRKSDIDYTFHIFFTQFLNKPSITLCIDECIDAQWLTMEKILELPLITGAPSILKIYQSWRKTLSNQ